MNEEENKNRDSKTNELIGRLKMQAERIIEKVKENDDEMCALIIIGTGGITLSEVHSKGGDKLVLAMANAIYRNPKLIDVIKCAMEVATRAAEHRAINHRETADEDETV